MEFRAEIVEYKQSTGEMTIKLYDQPNVKDLVASEYKGRLWGIFDTYEKDTITPDQRSHFYALMGDYETYTGTTLEAAESFFKYEFMIEKNLDRFPSLARNNMTMKQASELLEYVITYFIQNDIPFRKQQFYLTMDQSKMLYALTMKRICWVCGKPHADIHHATNLVGQGNNRKKHDHWNSTFMALCREHHNEAHTMGLDEFMKKHHVKPIKLNIEDLKQLKIM